MDVQAFEIREEDDEEDAGVEELDKGVPFPIISDESGLVALAQQLINQEELQRIREASEKMEEEELKRKAEKQGAKKRRKSRPKTKIVSMDPLPMRPVSSVWSKFPAEEALVSIALRSGKMRKTHPLTDQPVMLWNAVGGKSSYISGLDFSISFASRTSALRACSIGRMPDSSGLVLGIPEVTTWDGGGVEKQSKALQLEALRDSALTEAATWSEGQQYREEDWGIPFRLRMVEWSRNMDLEPTMESKSAWLAEDVVPGQDVTQNLFVKLSRAQRRYVLLDTSTPTEIEGVPPEVLPVTHCMFLARPEGRPRKQSLEVADDPMLLWSFDFAKMQLWIDPGIGSPFQPRGAGKVCIEAILPWGEVARTPPFHVIRHLRHKRMTVPKSQRSPKKRIRSKTGKHVPKNVDEDEEEEVVEAGRMAATELLMEADAMEKRYQQAQQEMEQLASPKL